MSNSLLLWYIIFQQFYNIYNYFVHHNISNQQRASFKWHVPHGPVWPRDSKIYSNVLRVQLLRIYWDKYKRIRSYMYVEKMIWQQVSVEFLGIYVCIYV